MFPETQVSSSTKFPLTLKKGFVTFESTTATVRADFKNVGMQQCVLIKAVYMYMCFATLKCMLKLIRDGITGDEKIMSVME